jgi:hypothetical protein
MIFLKVMKLVTIARLEEHYRTALFSLEIFLLIWVHQPTAGMEVNNDGK